MLMRALRRMLTMMFAIEEINQSTEVLPNITLGYLIYDVCRTMHTTLDATLNFLQEMIDNDADFNCKPSAVIGPSQSGISSAVAQFLGLFYIPQISYSSSCKCLSDKKKFPSFLRTIPSDSFQAFAVAKLVNYFAWLYVGTIEVSRDYGRVAIDQFTSEAEKSGICIAFREILPAAKDIEGLTNLGEQIAKSNTDIILVFGGEADIPPLARELMRRNITSKTLIASESWITSLFFLDPTYIQVYRGTIGFALQHGVIPGLKSYLLNFKPYYFGFCSQELAACVPPPLARPRNTRQATTSHDYCVAIGKSRLLQYIRNVNFINDIGELVNFDENGDPPARYELLNWQMDLTGNMHFKVVGAFDSSLAPENQLKLNETDIKWYSWNNQVPISICNKPCSPGTRKFARKGEPFCCFDCIPCAPGEFSNTTDSPECFHCDHEFWSKKNEDKCSVMLEDFLSFSHPLALTLLSFCILGLVLTICVELLLFIHRELPAVRTSSNMNTPLLVMIGGCFMSSLAFLGRPDDLQCRVREALASTVLSITIVCVVQKTIGLLIHGIGPPRPFRNTSTSPGTIILECAGAAPAWAVCGLLQIALLASICLGLASKAGKMPSAANEAKFISFSMIAFFLLCFCFVPAYFSTQGKLSVVTQLFSIIATAYAFLGCIFLPKCYYIFKCKRHM
uniref:extracellular calcium-sensing receptor-like n=1 Tax=Myxine glutinosa TaxID=7769 RepID=UPI00358FB052